MSVPLQHATSYPAVLGRLLVSARISCNLEQQAVADAVGVSRSTWSRIENGEIALTIEQLSAACAMLKIEPGQLVQQADAASKKLEGRGVVVSRARWESAGKAVGLGIVVMSAVALGTLIKNLLLDDEKK